MPRIVSEHFDSIHQLMYMCEHRNCNKVFAGRRPASRDKGESSKKFTGTFDYNEAVGLITNGFRDPLEKIRKGVTKTLEQSKAVPKAIVCNDIIGYAPCVPNAIIGIPQSMINKRITPIKQKVLTIVHDVTSNCSVEGEAFIKSGIAVLALVNSLELRGYRINLTVAFDNSHTINEDTFATLKVKDARQPLDLLKVTFPFCHPSMLRRFGFAWLETTPNLSSIGYRGSYGSSKGAHNFKEVKRELVAAKVLTEDVIFTNMGLCKKVNYDPAELAKALGLA